MANDLKRFEAVRSEREEILLDHRAVQRGRDQSDYRRERTKAKKMRKKMRLR